MLFKFLYGHFEKNENKLNPCAGKNSDFVKKLPIGTFGACLSFLQQPFNPASMKKCLLFFCFFSACSLKAQFGLTLGTTLNSSPDWQVAFENFVAHRHMNFLRNGTMAVLDITLPSSSPRWRFRPAVQGMRATAYFYPHYFEAYSIGFQYNVSYSPLDIGSKKLPVPLFVTLSPGLSMVAMQYEQPIMEGNQFTGDFIFHTDSQVAFHIGVGAFAEFALSPKLSISPVLGFRFFPNIDWTDFTFILTEGDMTNTYDRTTWRQFFFALRFGLDLRKKR
jgi:hypothetical protein